MSGARLRIGMLGGGMISQIAHLPFYLDDPRCEVVAIAESRPSLVAALRQRVPGAAIHSDVAEMLAHDIDAVVLSAPRPATGPLTLMALEAGRHVIAEKPMAHTVEQAERLVEAAGKRSLVYAVGFMKRYDPGIQAAKALFEEVVADGRLGRLLSARFFDHSNAYAFPPPPHVRPAESRQVRFPTWPTAPDWLAEEHRAAYAWYLNAASHDVNLLRWFFPEARAVSAIAPNPGGIAALLAAGDVPVTLDIAKSTAGRWIEGAEFAFENGRIAFSVPSPMDVDGVSEVTLDDREAGRTAERIETGRGWSFARQAAGFLDALEGTAPALTTGEDGLADMRLTEDIWHRIAERR